MIFLYGAMDRNDLIMLTQGRERRVHMYGREEREKEDGPPKAKA